jgi:hypothetical protein
VQACSIFVTKDPPIIGVNVETGGHFRHINPVFIFVMIHFPAKRPPAVEPFAPASAPLCADVAMQSIAVS